MIQSLLDDSVQEASPVRISNNAHRILYSRIPTKQYFCTFVSPAATSLLKCPLLLRSRRATLPSYQYRAAFNPCGSGFEEEGYGKIE
ncbi:MAG: hypothetical protein GYA15_06465 [Leptolinea sp.]|nr:hypothetical protein [Leptolinea sp.]